MKINEITVAIELKHLTRSILVEKEGQPYELKSQSAQDIGMNAFWHDIHRIETIVGNKPDRIGYALLLTNDPIYWNSPTRNDTNYFEFTLHEGRIVEPCALKWGPNTGIGTMVGREQPIQISNRHELHWKDYSLIAGKTYGKFRYLAVSVQGKESN